MLVPVGFKAVSVEENPDSIPTRKVLCEMTYMLYQNISRYFILVYKHACELCFIISCMFKSHYNDNSFGCIITGQREACEVEED